MASRPPHSYPFYSQDGRRAIKKGLLGLGGVAIALQELAGLVADLLIVRIFLSSGSF
jgi:hypothetical protein